LCILIALLPFRYPIAIAILNFGGTDKHICICLYTGIIPSESLLRFSASSRIVPSSGTLARSPHGTYIPIWYVLNSAILSFRTPVLAFSGASSGVLYHSFPGIAFSSLTSIAGGLSNYN
jgi:hypothetical protein